jgi:hypothetical protein
MLELISLAGALLELLDGIQGISITIETAARFAKRLLEIN